MRYDLIHLICIAVSPRPGLLPQILFEKNRWQLAQVAQDAGSEGVASEEYQDSRIISDEEG